MLWAFQQYGMWMCARKIYKHQFYITKIHNSDTDMNNTVMNNSQQKRDVNAMLVWCSAHTKPPSGQRFELARLPEMRFFHIPCISRYYCTKRLSNNAPRLGQPNKNLWPADRRRGPTINYQRPNISCLMGPSFRCEKRIAQLMQRYRSFKWKKYLVNENNENDFMLC